MIKNTKETAITITDLQQITNYLWYKFVCSCGKLEAKRDVSFKNSPFLKCGPCLRKETSLKLHGSSTWNNRNKSKETCMQKYGVDNASQTNSVKNKISEKVKKSELNGRREKRENTNLERYGAKNPSQNNIIKDKTKKTNQLRYGGNAPCCNKEVSDKLKESIIKKYGSFKNHPGSLKVKETYELKRNNQVVDLNLEWLDKHAFNGKYNDGTIVDLPKGPIYYQFKCLLCNSTFKDDFHGGNPTCRKCNPIKYSTLETEFSDYVESLVAIKKHDRLILDGKEIDVYIPSLNIGFEFDGIYWHADCTKTELLKQDLAKTKNIELYFVTDYDWNSKKDIVKSIVKSKILGPNNKIFARKCTVKEIFSKECASFLEQNHIQGSFNASVAIGLFYENKLVQVLTFSKSRFNKNYEWEIIREASLLDVAIIGGKNKLFNYFVKKYNPKSIITYCDKRFFNGNSYKKLNMIEQKDTSPTMWVVKNNRLLNRLKFQKHKLQSILEIYDKDLTANQNLISNGYQIFYDCGQKVYTKIF